MKRDISSDDAGKKFHCEAVKRQQDHFLLSRTKKNGRQLFACFSAIRNRRSIESAIGVPQREYHESAKKVNEYLDRFSFASNR
jgi:hypothetical protein